MRNAPIWGWLVSAAIAVAGGLLLVLQWQRVQQLRSEISLKRDGEVEGQRLRRNREALVREQIPAEELEKLRADRAAVIRLRTEIEALKAQAGRTKTVAKKAPPPAPPLIPAREWKNAGRATPEAALETLLSAAVAGNIGVLAAGLDFEAGGRAKVEALLASLPAEARSQYSTPEQLVALLTAKDIPTDGGMRVMVGSSPQENEKRLSLVFQNEKRTQSRFLTTRREGAEWKLIVPNAAVEKYVADLTGVVPSGHAK